MTDDPRVTRLGRFIRRTSIDELPQFTRAFETDSNADKAAVKTIRQGIWRLIALGRWAGMITVLSAQKPTVCVFWPAAMVERPGMGVTTTLPVAVAKSFSAS